MLTSSSRLLQALIPLPSFAEDPIIQRFLEADIFLKVSDKVSAAQNDEGLRGLQAPDDGGLVQSRIPAWAGVSLERPAFGAISSPGLPSAHPNPPSEGPETLGSPPSVLPHSAVPTVPAVHGGGVLWPCRAARASLQQDPLLPGPVSASLETVPSSVQYSHPSDSQFHCPCPDSLKKGFPVAMKKAGHE